MKPAELREFTAYANYEMPRKSRQKWEFGDFQTPQALAEEAVALLARRRISPQTIIEPTCGRGAFLLAAGRQFKDAKSLVGNDINPHYVAEIRRTMAGSGLAAKTTILNADFFSFDWSHFVSSLAPPILVIGNPPWVTSSDLAALKSRNVPEKSNFQKQKGFDAKTGKSNFDISESMLRQHLDWLNNRQGVVAVLCKTAVARKVLVHAWKGPYSISSATLFLIDAQRHFEASVDACFLVLEMSPKGGSADCKVYESLSATRPKSIIGYRDEIVLAEVSMYRRWRHVKGVDRAYVWRSGIKHDCSKVMELEKVGNKFKNGRDELVSLEDNYLYPMLKSSDVGNGKERMKYMLVTQRYTGEQTVQMKATAPKTWRYLNNHREDFDKRASSIYRNRPAFSIFGVGTYTFAPWKVAISGFYRDLIFKVIGPRNDKTVVFDDTVYFLPCWSEAEARFVCGLLESKPAREFYRSMIFWTDKRPITAEILNRLDLGSLSVELGLQQEYQRLTNLRSVSKQTSQQKELPLWVA